MIEWEMPRRLPVYLLLDCSTSMAGAPIQALNEGVSLLYQELISDPRSADTVHISIIPFASSAYQMDLVPITQFNPPQLEASGRRSLGAALRLLNQSLDNDLIADQPGKKGDYKPQVMLLIGGQPTDAWEQEAVRLKARTTGPSANVVALAIGNDVDIEKLKQITENVLKIGNVSAESLRAFFQWVSHSVAHGSRPAAPSLPPRPQGLTSEHAEVTVPHSQQAPSPYIFVSHSHHDAAFTSRLVGDLRAAGAQVWVDDADMHPGEFPQQINDALAAADWVIVVLTPQSAVSRWVRREVNAGIERMDHGFLKGVIPVMAAHTEPRDIPPLWLNLHRYDATRDYDAALRGVLRAING